MFTHLNKWQPIAFTAVANDFIDVPSDVKLTHAAEKRKIYSMFVAVYESLYMQFFDMQMIATAVVEMYETCPHSGPGGVYLVSCKQQ